MGRKAGVPNNLGEQAFILECLPGTLDSIEKKVKKKYPDILRSTIRGRLSELVKKNKVCFELDEGIKVYSKVFGDFCT